MGWLRHRHKAMAPLSGLVLVLLVHLLPLSQLQVALAAPSQVGLSPVANATEAISDKDLPPLFVGAPASATTGTTVPAAAPPTHSPAAPTLTPAPTAGDADPFDGMDFSIPGNATETFDDLDFSIPGEKDPAVEELERIEAEEKARKKEEKRLKKQREKEEREREKEERRARKQREKEEAERAMLEEQQRLEKEEEKARLEEQQRLELEEEKARLEEQQRQEERKEKASLEQAAKQENVSAEHLSSQEASDPQKSAKSTEKEDTHESADSSKEASEAQKSAKSTDGQDTHESADGSKEVSETRKTDENTSEVTKDVEPSLDGVTVPATPVEESADEQSKTPEVTAAAENADVAVAAKTVQSDLGVNVPAEAEVAVVRSAAPPAAAPEPEWQQGTSWTPAQSPASPAQPGQARSAAEAFPVDQSPAATQARAAEPATMRDRVLSRYMHDVHQFSDTKALLQNVKTGLPLPAQDHQGVRINFKVTGYDGKPVLTSDPWTSGAYTVPPTTYAAPSAGPAYAASAGPAYAPAGSTYAPSAPTTYAAPLPPFPTFVAPAAAPSAFGPPLSPTTYGTPPAPFTTYTASPTVTTTYVASAPATTTTYVARPPATTITFGTTAAAPAAATPAAAAPAKPLYFVQFQGRHWPVYASTAEATAAMGNVQLLKLEQDQQQEQDVQQRLKQQEQDQQQRLQERLKQQEQEMQQLLKEQEEQVRQRQQKIENLETRLKEQDEEARLRQQQWEEDKKRLEEEQARERRQKQEEDLKRFREEQEKARGIQQAELQIKAQTEALLKKQQELLQQPGQQAALQGLRLEQERGLQQQLLHRQGVQGSPQLNTQLPFVPQTQASAQLKLQPVSSTSSILKMPSAGMSLSDYSTGSSSSSPYVANPSLVYSAASGAGPASYQLVFPGMSGVVRPAAPVVSVDTKTLHSQADSRPVYQHPPATPAWEPVAGQSPYTVSVYASHKP